MELPPSTAPVLGKGKAGWDPWALIGGVGVFDFVAKKTMSKEFVLALYRLSSKYPEETKENKLDLFIEDAARIVGL